MENRRPYHAKYCGIYKVRNTKALREYFDFLTISLIQMETEAHSQGLPHQIYPQFIQDFLTYNSGNESPKNYHVWNALALLSCVASRKIWLPVSDPRIQDSQGYFIIYPNLYVTHVGEQGGRKTTSKDNAYKMLRKAVPTIPVSAECMSREAITDFMADDHQLRSFKHPITQGLIEYRPFCIWATELKYFLSINPINMLDFLTAIYDRDFLDYKIRGRQGDGKTNDVLINPYVVFVACETPDWLQERLKQKIISGGISRRMIYVYETDDAEPITFPTKSKPAIEAELRCIEHLKKLDNIVGEIKWTEEAAAFFEKWYVPFKKAITKIPDSMMRGWARGKYLQVLKVASLCALGESIQGTVEAPKLPLLLTRNHLFVALKILTDLEKGMQKLWGSSGKNPLAVAAERMIELLTMAGTHPMTSSQLSKVMWNELEKGDLDLKAIIDHCKSTGKIAHVRNQHGFEAYLTKENYAKVQQEKEEPNDKGTIQPINEPPRGGGITPIRT